MLQPLDLGNSLMVMLVGITIVFIGLVVLIFLIKVLVKATDGFGKKKQAPAPAAPAPAAAPAEEVPEAPAAQDETPLVAAITAALAVVLERDASAFTVRRIRRVGNPAWNRLGKEVQMNSHF